MVARREDVKKCTGRNTGESSYMVFRTFVRKDETTGRVDASGILSKECYLRWLSTRVKEPKVAPRAFKDALKATLTGSNRCTPFPKDVEDDLLTYLRSRGNGWPCFEDMQEVNIGKRGWKRVRGFHEIRSVQPHESPQHSNLDDDTDSCAAVENKRVRLQESVEDSNEDSLNLSPDFDLSFPPDVDLGFSPDVDPIGPHGQQHHQHGHGVVFDHLRQFTRDQWHEQQQDNTLAEWPQLYHHRDNRSTFPFQEFRFYHEN